ncbi:MAG TPA: tol-pal system protein YbgF [Motiliproteus sp.]
MKVKLLLLSLAALTGGQCVYGAPPVVELSPTPIANSTPATTAEVAPVTVTPTAKPSVQRNPVGELLLLIDQLQEEVRFLRGRVEEQENQMRRMREDGRDRYRDLDRRITLLSQQQASALPPVRTPAVVATEPVSNLAVGIAPSTAAPSKPVVVPVTAAPVDYANADTEAFKAAFELVIKRSFPEALNAFADFQTRYPQSSLIANVLYWTGEVERAKNEPDLGAAQQAYSAMLQRYPSHAKAAEAYYKLGLTYQGLGDLNQARVMMQTVVDRYPEQSSAKLAREFLSRN